MPRLFLLASLTLAALACREGPPPRPAPQHEPHASLSPLRDAPQPAPVTTDASVDAPSNAAPSDVADTRTWPFVEHARRWCLPDRLAHTPYLSRWVPLHRQRLPAGDALPAIGRFLPGQRAVYSDETTPEDQQRLLAWQSSPRVSHVMDCVLRVPIPGADRERSSTYTIYLPADYLDHPTRPRPVLLLVSGGNGNRSRWFLTPTGDDGVTPGTGGLEVRRRADAWVAAHPSLPAPLIVGLDGTSDQFPNGMAAFIGRELPTHLLATYLPGITREGVPWGVECISSGCAEVMMALQSDARAFQVVGLLSPYVHSSGIDVTTSFGNVAQRTAFFRSLANLHHDGTFDLRFSVGNLDSHLPRVRALYDMFVDVGFYERAETPTYSDCEFPRARPSSSQCTAAWPGFFLFHNVAHHYRALIPAFPPAFAWQLDTLTLMVDRLQHGPRSPGAPTADAGVADAR